jgi:hypothetical protein
VLIRHQEVFNNLASILPLGKRAASGVSWLFLGNRCLNAHAAEESGVLAPGEHGSSANPYCSTFFFVTSRRIFVLTILKQQVFFILSSSGTSPSRESAPHLLIAELYPGLNSIAWDGGMNGNLGTAKQLPSAV